MDITIRKRANMLEISPAIKLLHLLTPVLTFQRIKPRYGIALAKGKSRIDRRETYLYRLDEDNDKLYTFAGFLTRLVDLLRSYHHNVEVMEQDPIKQYEPVYENLKGVELRKSQEEMLAVILGCDRAQLNGLTAMGKSFLIKQAVRLFPYPDCYIVIAAQQRPIVNAFYRDLVEMFPGEVGQVGCGRKDPRRITVSTAKSLMKCKVEKTRMLFYDEVHTAGSEKTSKDLVNFMNCKMFGFSASTECRSDKADAMVEALFGPVRIEVPYQQGVEEGIVPQIDTHFYRVGLGEFQHKNPVVRKRHQIWNNSDWNNAVMQVVRYWEEQLEDPQILILTDALEHVARLGKLLPDYEWIYGSTATKRTKRLFRWNLVPQDWRPEFPRKMKEKIWKFEAGAIRKVISTMTLGTGVDLRHLDVLVRADGGSSEISNIQYRGRVTRGQHGIYCDFMVEGDSNERSRSRKRFRSCQAAGWDPKEEELPDAD